ncbi:MAG: DNA mismatch repair endonuclease MutL [Lachnospiraceae bacterium]|nr:DNA mismatch repair endonuclease MutL [Lachnospiraceae bacterium]
MNRIALLDKSTIDKIAAGEVVDRPASIVKELVENAVDAGATAVTVEIKEGGISFIRITDNGSGIPGDQIKIAFLRHATSKIRSVEDLQQVASLGFRGEALSSIAAVAQVELITKAAEALTGIRYVIEGGEEKLLEEIGAPNGTTFLIRNLFFNTPARAKFLKSAQAEGNAISALVEQMALSNPEISFKYMINGQVKLHTTGNPNIKELVYHIYGRELTRELLELHYQDERMSVEGFIAKPSVARGNRNFENYYVNGRYVKSKLIAKAVEDGYHGFLMQHKYPFTLLYMTLDGKQVDVNVHPSKMELRFSSQDEIYHALVSTIRETLAQKERIPEVHLSAERKEAAKQPEEKLPVPEPFEVKRRSSMPIYPEGYKAQSKPFIPEREIAQQTKILAMAKQLTTEIRETGAYQETKADPLLPEVKKDLEIKPQIKAVQQMELFDDKVLSKKARISYKIIGQLFDTYWLMQYEENLYIIDQHAAHEKVLYERMMAGYQQKTIHAQMVSPPVVVTLTLPESELLEKYVDVFARFGFEIENFGGREFQITAVPDNLYGIATDEIFREILDHLEDTGSRTLDAIGEKIASMSCKAAVKGNHRLSLAEVEALFDELLTLENPYNCPHGRPTIISMSKYELEKKFKRIV